MTEEQAAKASPSELIEAGIDLIARGLFRRGDKSGENDPQSAFEDGFSAAAVIRDMAFGFLKDYPTPRSRKTGDEHGR